MTTQADDMIGTKFGDLTVKERTESRRYTNATAVHSQYICTCTCGREEVFLGYRLKRGDHEKCSECRKAESAPAPHGCPCGETDPAKFSGRRSACMACDRRTSRNGSCDECGNALYRRGKDFHCRVCNVVKGKISS